MDRIIRLNAVETSSQSESLEINQQDVHPCYNLSPEMASIYGGSAASVGAVLLELPTDIYNAKVKSFQTGNTSVGNYSTSLQKLLEQRPSVLPYLILLGGLAFFTTVLIWLCTGKIQEVSQIQGRFASVGELHQPVDTSLVLVAILPSEKVGFVKKGEQVKIKLDVDSEHSQSKAGKQNAHSNRNNKIFLGRVASISSHPQPDEKLGWVHQLEIAVDPNQTVNFRSGQKTTAQIIHHRRIADMFLRPIKELQHGESNF